MAAGSIPGAGLLSDRGRAGVLGVGIGAGGMPRGEHCRHARLVLCAPQPGGRRAGGTEGARAALSRRRGHGHRASERNLALCSPMPALLPCVPACVRMHVLFDCYATAASSCRRLDPTQSLVEDTHLHALFQRLLEQIEVQLAHAARKQDPDRIPKLSRQGVLDLVREAPHSSSSSSSSTRLVRSTYLLRSSSA